MSSKPRIKPADAEDGRPVSISARLGRLQFHYSGKFRVLQIADILQAKPQDFDVLSGDDAITFEMLGLGAVGVISVIGNAYPALFSRMINCHNAGNESEALAIHRSMNELYKLMSVDGNPAGVKSLLALQGKIDNVLRLPLVPASQSTQDALKKVIAELG